MTRAVGRVAPAGAETPASMADAETLDLSGLSGRVQVVATVRQAD